VLFATVLDGDRLGLFSNPAFLPPLQKRKKTTLEKQAAQDLQVSRPFPLYGAGKPTGTQLPRVII